MMMIQKQILRRKVVRRRKERKGQGEDVKRKGKGQEERKGKGQEERNVKRKDQRKREHVGEDNFLI